MIENENGGVDFCITGVYLWMSQTLSKEESTVFNRKVINALNYNGWKKTGENQYALGELELSIQNYKVHPEDIKVNRVIPKNYRTIEYRLKSNDMTTENRVIDSPWVILNSGMRKQGNRTETPYISDKVELIQEYLPMQIEIAGGASIDLGIPPLNYLHSVYNVNNKETGDYIFGNDDFLPNLIADPIKFYEKAGEAYRLCILAQPNAFYRLLKRLFDIEWAVGKVITNNFDGLTALVGIADKYVRRYDEPKHYPKIDLIPVLVPYWWLETMQIEERCKRRREKEG